MHSLKEVIPAWLLSATSVNYSFKARHHQCQLLPVRSTTMDFSKALKTNPEPTSYPPLWYGPPKIETPEPEPWDDKEHPLLSQESPAYSASVIQRAFISWAHLGKKNGFRQTCDYYHRLEKLVSRSSILLLLFFTVTFL